MDSRLLTFGAVLAGAWAASEIRERYGSGNRNPLQLELGDKVTGRAAWGDGVVQAEGNPVRTEDGVFVEYLVKWADGDRAWHYDDELKKVGGANNGRDLPAGHYPMERHVELSDGDLWDLVESGQSTLAGMEFDAAVLSDPRRIDAMIHQSIGQGLMETLGAADPMGAELRKEVYLNAMAMLRQAHGGEVSAQALTLLQDESWVGALLTAVQFWPMGMKEALRSRWDVMSAAFDRAADIARRAEGVARRQGRGEDNIAWADYATTLENQKDGMFRVTTMALPGPAGRGPRMFGGPRRGLPGPRGRG